MESELDGKIRPSFMDKPKQKIRIAKMELHGRLFLICVGNELIGQCHVDHPGLVRHLQQLERIFEIKIQNKEWMMREVLMDDQEDIVCSGRT
jgi:hypothetical protein